jgi:ketosteroid isomerase-like protein
VAVLAGLIGVAACRIQEVPRTGRADPAEIAREEIDATRDAYRQALLDGDANGVSGVFTRDGTLWEPDAPDVVGSGAIEAAMRRLFDDAVVTDLLLEPDPLDIATGGIAFELGRFEEIVQLAEQPPVTLRGRYAIRWLRGANGDWRIGHMLKNRYPSDTSAIR